MLVVLSIKSVDTLLKPALDFLTTRSQSQLAFVRDFMKLHRIRPLHHYQRITEVVFAMAQSSMAQPRHSAASNHPLHQ